MKILSGRNFVWTSELVLGCSTYGKVFTSAIQHGTNGGLCNIQTSSGYPVYSNY